MHITGQLNLFKCQQFLVRKDKWFFHLTFHLERKVVNRSCSRTTAHIKNLFYRILTRGNTRLSVRPGLGGKGLLFKIKEFYNSPRQTVLTH
jgi:hypothetical protein